MSTRVGTCLKCGKPNKLLTPLHGDRGGPEYCVHCGMDWHAEFGRRRKLGRVVVKAIKAFLDAGGAFTAIDRLKLAATGFSFMPGEADTIGADVGDITTELLEAAIRLTHPDRHPPERQDEAKRVTAELLALKPFVFPAPKPKPTRNASAKDAPRPLNESLREAFERAQSSAYPCELCVDQVPYLYCGPCRARWDVDRKAERERRNAKQRQQYAARNAWKRHPRACLECGGTFKPSRKDAKYCSAACRQRSHRHRVTDAQVSQAATLRSRNGAAP